MTAFAKEGAGQDEDGSGTHAAPAMSGQSCRPHTAHNDTGSQAPGAHVHGRRKSRCSRTRKQRRVWGTVGRCGSVHWREVMPLEPSALTVWSVVSTVVCPCRCRRRGRVYASAVSLQVFPGATIGCEQLKADMPTYLLFIVDHLFIADRSTGPSSPWFPFLWLGFWGLVFWRRWCKCG